MTIYSDRDYRKLLLGINENVEIQESDLEKRIEQKRKASIDENDDVGLTFLHISPFPKAEHMQPSSIDIPCGRTVYESKGKRTLTRLDDQTLKEYFTKMKESDEYLLEPGSTYVVESQQRIRVRWCDEGVSETKSSSGRIGLLCLALGKSYGVVEPSDVPQKMRMLVEPYPFKVKIVPDQTVLFQLRIRKKTTGLISHDILKEYYIQEDNLDRFRSNGGKNLTVHREGKSLPFDMANAEDGIQLTLSTHMAFVQREDASKLEPIDLSRKGYYNPEEYFDVQKGREGRLDMKPNLFYLFGNRESVFMKNVAARIEREDPKAGVGFLHHFAGWFDPYWEGPGTLEMYSFKPRILSEGQPAGKLFFEELTSPVMKQYGQMSGSHYKGQIAPRIGKMFKQVPPYAIMANQ